MLQETVFRELVSKKVPVRIFMLNGYQMRGTVIQADTSVVLLESEGVCKVINTSAISTIEPMAPFKPCRV